MSAVLLTSNFTKCLHPVKHSFAYHAVSVQYNPCNWWCIAATSLLHHRYIAVTSPLHRCYIPVT